MSGRLAGKVAVITGAGSGMGKATALLMAREGAAVGVADIDVARAEAVVETIVEEGHRALSLKVDIADEESNHAMVDAVLAEFGALHIAHLHAAGGRDSSVLEPSIEGFDAAVATTLRGTFLGMIAVAPHMVAAGGGSIVCTASTATVFGAPDMMAYCATKSGVVGLMRSAAVELGCHNIRVNAIAPTFTYTGVFNSFYKTAEAMDADLGRFHTLNRVARPEDVANLVTFLASDESSFITGQLHVIDGGHTTTMPVDLLEVTSRIRDEVLTLYRTAQP